MCCSFSDAPVALVLLTTGDLLLLFRLFLYGMSGFEGFVDPLDPEDPYPQLLWDKFADYIEKLCGASAGLHTEVDGDFVFNRGMHSIANVAILGFCVSSIL